MKKDEVTGTPGVVILLGAGRGGTTLLYKLLSLHRDVAYLSNYEARAPRWPSVARVQRLFRNRHTLKLQTWFGEDGGAYFDAPRRRLHALVPTPVEGEPVYAAAGVPEEPAPGQAVDLAACERLASRMHGIRAAAGARVLLTKRTSNNRRVAWLERAAPQARYIHLLRDGRAVAASLLKVEWWPSHGLFWGSGSPREMEAMGHHPLALAAENWSREVEGIDAALSNVEPGRVHELHYEQLLHAPVPALRSMLAFMGIDACADPAYESSVDRIGLRPAPVGPPSGWDAQDRMLVWSIQHKMLTAHGYEP
jgi:hypothetical protein